jgi:hypothetical protein
MLSTLFKLVYTAAAILGPFLAGAANAIVRDPGAQAALIVLGVGIGLMGLFGFAGLERDEAVDHARRLSGEG